MALGVIASAVSSRYPMHHLLRRKAMFLIYELRGRLLRGLTLEEWAQSVTNRAISAHYKSGCISRMEFDRFALLNCCKAVINPCHQVSNMSSQSSAIFPGQLHCWRFENSSVLGSRPSCGGMVRSSASLPGFVYHKAYGCSGAQEVELQNDRDRREQRLWEKGLRKNIYDSLQKDRITVELFPKLDFPLDGNFYPKLLPLLAQKINTLVDKDADHEIAQLLDFLGVSLNPHLVGEVLKLRYDWVKSLRFFLWAKYQPQYEHTAHTYNMLLCNLAKAKNERPDDVVVSLHLLQEMVRKELVPSNFTVNIVIDRLCKAKKTKAALEVMRELEENGASLDVITYNSIINGLGKAGKFKEVFELLEEMEQKGIKPNLFTYNSIIHSLGNSHRWQEAWKVFDELLDRGLTPDVVTYNSIIRGLYKGGQATEAFKVFGLMSLRGCEPDVVTYNSLIYGLAKASSLDDSLKIFNFMKRKNCIPDVITYNILIGEFISVNEFTEVSGLLLEMKEMGCRPDRITHNLLLEIGQVDRLNVLWGPEAATDGPNDNDDGSNSGRFGANNAR